MRLTASMLLALAACASRAPVAGPSQASASAQLASFAAPADAQRWFLRAAYATANGDQPQADRAIAWATRLDPRNPDVYAASGSLLGSVGRWADAAQLYDRAILLSATPALELLRDQALACAQEPDLCAG